jgi:TetR/AcrR family transcriptional repressor of uid operon
MKRIVFPRQDHRRKEILNAAQRCFVRSGFHQTSMQEICAEAQMSAGNLYRYFPSKETIIAGITERDRAEVVQDFTRTDLSQELFAALEAMARHYFTVRSIEQVSLCTEIMSEARHNPEVARISAVFEVEIRKWLTSGFDMAAKRGDISKDADIEGAVNMLMIIADGFWWRRVLDPQFKVNSFISTFVDVARHLLRSQVSSEIAGGHS